LTPGALDATRALLPVAFGGGKAAILAAILDGPRDERRLPAQRARRAGATWVLDAAAASDLSRH
jgi:6-phosphogluconolactonase/glucosamine-6-phosphate isomerase/deaminase